MKIFPKFQIHPESGKMKSKIHIWLNNRYPQNYILKNPYFGSALYLLICLIFLVTYRPLRMHASLSFSFLITMAIYFLASAIGVFILIQALKFIPYFSNKQEWNITKELLSIFLVLTGAGIALYLMGFLMEEPADRWNLATFIDSCKYAFLIGIIPFGFFTLINYRYLMYKEISLDYKSDLTAPENAAAKREDLIKIISRLKKEELSFYPHQLLFAESDGNYVVFHLIVDQKYHKESIRNSLNEIEKHLSHVPYFTRIHRAFIVNVRKVRTKRGNALGYKLRLYGTEAEIPVSRQNVHAFDQLLNKYKS
jgi:hypothetical protein